MFLFRYWVFKSTPRPVCVWRRVKKKPPQCCLLFSLVQKAVGAVRSLTPTSSPLSSPSKHGDRFIPSRAGANWSVNFHRINVSLPQQQIHQALFCLSYQKNSALKMKVFVLFFLIHLSLQNWLRVIIYWLWFFFNTGNWKVAQSK